MINNKTLNRIKLLQEQSLLKAGVYLEGKLKKEVSTDTGSLARSIEAKKKDESTVRVGSGLPQAFIEEYGRKPGRFVPFDALVGRAGRRGFTRGRKTGGYNSLDSSDKSKIFLLSRAIKNRGISAKKTFSNTWMKESQNVYDLYAKLLKQGIG